MSADKVCHFCAKRSIDFTDIKKFYFHVRSHQSVPNNCCICDKTYKSKAALNEHTRTVHTENTFCCEVCDKKYSTNYNLTKHMKIHTRTITTENKEKGNFPCPECTKDYSYKYGLNKYMKKEHSFNQVSCFTCDNVFKTASDLKRHINNNHAIQKYDSQN